MLTKFKLLIAIIGMIIALASCVDDNVQPVVEEPSFTKSIANFTDSFIHISENDISGYPIEIVLDKPCSYNGTLNLKIDDIDMTNVNRLYSFIPHAIGELIEVNVSAGQSIIRFELFSINNNEYNDNHEFNISIEENNFITKGNNSNLIIRIEEDDAFPEKSPH